MPDVASDEADPTFQLLEDDTIETVVADYREQIAGSNEVLGSVDLDAPHTQGVPSYTPSVTQNALDRLRSVALTLPGVEERVSHHAPCFYVRKRAICRFHDADFGADDRVALWCLSSPSAVEELVVGEPERFFQPTPSASGVFAGWIGVYLDATGRDAVDWDEIGAILEEAFRLVAPKRLVAELDQRSDQA